MGTLENSHGFFYGTKPTVNSLILRDISSSCLTELVFIIVGY